MKLSVPISPTLDGEDHQIYLPPINKCHISVHNALLVSKLHGEMDPFLQPVATCSAQSALVFSLSTPLQLCLCFWWIEDCVCVRCEDSSYQLHWDQWGTTRVGTVTCSDKIFFVSKRKWDISSTGTTQSTAASNTWHLNLRMNNTH